MNQPLSPDRCPHCQQPFATPGIDSNFCPTHGWISKTRHTAAKAQTKAPRTRVITDSVIQPELTPQLVTEVYAAAIALPSPLPVTAPAPQTIAAAVQLDLLGGLEA